MHRLLSILAAVLLWGAPAAQAGEQYVLGKVWAVYGEVFCKSAEVALEVADAYKRSRTEGEEIEKKSCVIPVVDGVDMQTRRPTMIYVFMRVKLVKILETIKVPGDEVGASRVTIVEVIDEQKKVYYMTTYRPVSTGVEEMPL